MPSSSQGSRVQLPWAGELIPFGEVFKLESGSREMFMLVSRDALSIDDIGDGRRC